MVRSIFEKLVRVLGWDIAAFSRVRYCQLLRGEDGVGIAVKLA